MARESVEELSAILDKAADGLLGVTKKRMFGCDGLFANGNVFGLVWKEGRIGVRLPNEIAYAEAMKMPGASPWQAGTMTMSHWVLVPQALHADTNRLRAWVRRAHALAASAPARAPAAAKPPVPAVTKATATKRTSAGRPKSKVATASGGTTPTKAAKPANRTRATKTSARPAAKTASKKKRASGKRRP